jgi:aspartate kinase
MTNAFEAVVDAYYNKDEELPKKLNFIEEFHKNIMSSLFDKEDTIYKDIDILFGELGWFLARNTSQRYNYVYDQIICFGEMLSTKIVSAYLLKIGADAVWFDVRNYIKTDSNYRDAKVDWELTETLISTKVDTTKINVTQGFVAANDTENTTTLGREGSDYTAGIFAYCLNAESVTIWKDVKGVLNADPRVFSDTTLLEQISYEEAIEMAFYGASVIHPKTLQPLERKEIPLLVRSFINPKETGTRVTKGTRLVPYIPCFIVKKDQILVSISALDFSFMVENNISYIFKKLHDYQLKVNLIQNSAISFSVCIDNKFNKFDAFYEELKTQFKIDVQKGVDLYTVRHFDDKAVAVIEAKGNSLLTQINKETIQIVLATN